MGVEYEIIGQRSIGGRGVERDGTGREEGNRERERMGKEKNRSRGGESLE